MMLRHFIQNMLSSWALIRDIGWVIFGSVTYPPHPLIMNAISPVTPRQRHLIHEKLSPDTLRLSFFNHRFGGVMKNIFASTVIAFATLSASQAAVLISLNQAPATTAATTTFITGFRFTVGASDISVTRLGTLDLGTAGLSSSFNVGIWNSSLSLVASATVPSGGTPESQFIYANLGSPVTLSASQNYFIGSVATATGDNIGQAAGPLVTTFNSAVTPFATASQRAFYSSTTGGAIFATLATPGYASSGFNTYPNANADFTVVPEPSTALLVGAAAAGFLVIARRRRSS